MSSTDRRRGDVCSLCSSAVSDHQLKNQSKPCWMCASGMASNYNHCTWCGATLPSTKGLINHLDDGCQERIENAARVAAYLQHFPHSH